MFMHMNKDDVDALNYAMSYGIPSLKDKFFSVLKKFRLYREPRLTVESLEATIKAMTFDYGSPSKILMSQDEMRNFMGLGKLKKWMIGVSQTES